MEILLISALVVAGFMSVSQMIEMLMTEPNAIGLFGSLYFTVCAASTLYCAWLVYV